MLDLLSLDVSCVSSSLYRDGQRGGLLKTSILPALAFSLDMFAKTAMSYGVNEVLLASVLGAVVFSLLAAQPLVIVGVTGKIILLETLWCSE